ncbi:MAG: bifunctional [glutamine synthetase] adenylyltransferase/[glutamine synthetase]-adenylyl-L-tyrosine phosphorylase [Streptosporangiales bacterium]|nr:bifunctional [glutamine synthetase] adenylyltransferase/[glutamine synthetase]-adenylyl-L-tyrosine phosphorylase [Streptosporangiales bacterium]
MREQRRLATTAGRLARLGFEEPGRAERLLAEVGLDLEADSLVVEALAATADPDLALGSLARLTEALTKAAPDRDELLQALNADEELRDRLLRVLGVSAALGDHLARHPEHWRVLRAPRGLPRPGTAELRAAMLRAVGADPSAAEPRAGIPDAAAALRVAYRRRLLHLVARDVTGTFALDDVAAELADLAAAALEAALAIGRAELPADAEPCRLAVIGMGKCGGQELNYVSDVDVVFVAEPRPGGDETAALRTATALASAMMRACSQSTSEGSLWQVDAALRPEGKAGPLVRTLASHLAYYRRWAKTWEFQALLKARPVAGDLELGGAYLEAVTPLVWRAAERDNFVEDVQAMRRRVEAHVPRDHADRQLKLGPGGLRDVEFAVQLLQLVHGRSDEGLRSRTTLAALDSLSRGGYVGRTDAASLAAAYRFLRSLEHLIQLHHLRRTHLVPSSANDLRRLGRALGFRTDPVADLTAEWGRHAREVRRIHEKLFYRPLLLAVARLPTEEARLTTDAARARLEALGYTDPAGALRHIQALTSGVSRRAAIQRTLLPVMLGWFADAPDPDAGLLAFRQVSDALGSTPWYLRLLRDEGAAAERMARLLSSGRYVTDLLLRAPEAVAMLGDDAELAPRPYQVLEAEALAVARHHDDPDDAIAAVRALRRRELFRIAVADLVGMLDVGAVGAALTEVTVATLVAGLEAATGRVETLRGGRLPTRLCVVAMGRLGGWETGYGSDADVMFVHQPYPGVDERAAHDAAHAVVEELRRLLARPAPDPPLHVDPDLRPEGRQGPLVRTLASYAAYYDRWSSPWERQALLRAWPIAGDSELGERFRALIDPMRWPRGGVDADAVREIRRLKARMEAERLPRGADPATHTKLGRGGLSDVEWVVQLLQLQHAHELPSLRTTRTLDALAAADAAGLLEDDDARVLTEAWQTATRVRNTIMLVRGRASDSLPTDVRDRARIARVLGYPPGRTGDLVEDYRRITRRARSVMERVFYG